MLEGNVEEGTRRVPEGGFREGEEGGDEVYGEPGFVGWALGDAGHGLVEWLLHSAGRGREGEEGGRGGDGLMDEGKLADFMGPRAEEYPEGERGGGGALVERDEVGEGLLISNEETGLVKLEGDPSPV